MPRLSAVLAAGGLFGAASAQQIGHQGSEGHPPLSTEFCGQSGCQPEPGGLVMDFMWRWLHNKDGYNNCLLSKGWDKSLCPDGSTCAQHCAVEGEQASKYSTDMKVNTFGGDSLRLTYPQAPRLYLTDGGGDRYRTFRLMNREISFEVDVSTLPCGMNAALYFIEMPADGGGAGTPGARYGMGYCDAQCPHMKFIHGEANTEHWKTRMAMNPDGKWIKVGPDGGKGICCAEMDIFEGNREANAFTAHPCKHPGDTVCEGDEQCGNKDKGITGWCDKDGCGFNPYMMGRRNFWGPGPEYTVDTTKPVTIVTQFMTTDGSDTGDLQAIRRIYVQDGRVIDNPQAANLDAGGDSLTDELCDAQVRQYNATGSFREAGGMKAIGEALKREMVLSMSIWDDNFGRMLWLDAEKPKFNKDVNVPGVARGPCPFDYGTHADNMANARAHGDIEVTFSKIRYGAIGSTEKRLVNRLRKFELGPSGRLGSHTRGATLRVPAAVVAAVTAVAAIAAAVLGVQRWQAVHSSAHAAAHRSLLLCSTVEVAEVPCQE